LKDPGIDGRIILKWIFQRLNGGALGWIDLAQDGDKWQAFVNIVIKPLGSLKWGIY
jgi:hypothetical protein